MATPKRQRIASDTNVPVKAHPSVIDDLSVAPRVDGVPGDSGGRRNRERTRRSEPAPVAGLDLFEMMARFAPLWEISAEYDLPREGPGRPMQTRPVCVFLVEMLTWELRTVSKSIRWLSSPAVWRHLRDAVEYAYPDHPERRLPETMISREQYLYFKRTRMENDEAADQLRALNREWGIAAALAGGAGDPAAGSLTHPHPSQVIAGDATNLRAMVNAGFEDAVDKETGEMLTRRYDPDALKYHSDGEKSGHTMVHAIARNAGSNERFVLDLDLKPRGIGDGTMFTDMVLPLFEQMPGMRAATYDMALHPGDYDRILSAGRIPVIKTALTAKRERVAMNFGEHEFRAKGKPMKTLNITNVDGTPCVSLPTPEGPQPFELKRHRNKARKNKSGAHIVYGVWRIPDLPEVPKSHRGYEVWISHNSTIEEIARKKPRTRALKVIPASDPDFAKLFGIREDTESMHNHMKTSMVNKRLRHLGRHRVLFNLHAYQLRTNMMALLAHFEGNEEALERWFGRSRPPNEHRLAA